MPQEIRVVQCFECEMFQVDIVKKSNKWQCKVCNAKQTLRKELFRGSGAECRQKVQIFNKSKAEKIAQKSNEILDLLADNALHSGSKAEENLCINTGEVSKKNKWEGLLKDVEKDDHSRMASKHVYLEKSVDCGYDSLSKENLKRKVVSETEQAKNKKSKWNAFL